MPDVGKNLGRTYAVVINLLFYGSPLSGMDLDYTTSPSLLSIFFVILSLYL